MPAGWSACCPFGNDGGGQAGMAGEAEALQLSLTRCPEVRISPRTVTAMAGTLLSSKEQCAAVWADTVAAQMGLAAHTLRAHGDAKTAEALLEMARHNRIVGLKLRAELGLARVSNLCPIRS